MVVGLHTYTGEQMNKAPTPCIENGCDNYVVNNARCQQHQNLWQASTRKARLPKDWNTRRQIVFRKHQGICYLCGESGADTIDHIIPGDNHSIENLAPVHDRTPPHCHRKKTAQEATNARFNNRIKKS